MPYHRLRPCGHEGTCWFCLSCVSHYPDLPEIRTGCVPWELAEPRSTADIELLRQLAIRAPKPKAPVPPVSTFVPKTQRAQWICTLGHVHVAPSKHCVPVNVSTLPSSPSVKGTGAAGGGVRPLTVHDAPGVASVASFRPTCQTPVSGLHP